LAIFKNKFKDVSPEDFFSQAEKEQIQGENDEENDDDDYYRDVDDYYRDEADDVANDSNNTLDDSSNRLWSACTASDYKEFSFPVGGLISWWKFHYFFHAYTH